MSIYCQPADCTDPAVRVLPAHCEAADTRVYLALNAKGIRLADIDQITLPNETLRALAVAYAQAIAALEGSRGDSELLAKHQAYEALAKSLASGIDREALGLDIPTDGAAGWGSIPIGRG